MKTIGLAAGLVLIVGLSACGGSDEDAPVMPGVVGERLDVAFGDIKDAGFDDDVDVDGGGALGIIDESNWQVCEQTPAAGEPMTGAPKLTVDRSCGGDGEEDESPTTATETPETPETTTTAAAANLTAANNPELAALLADDECGDSIAQFASKYRGRTIEFDGNIGAMQPHEDYDTRYDILVLAGDFNPETNPGPNFVFRDVNTTYDLHYTGDVPDTIGQGTNLHVVAEVGDYEVSRCLFLLEPVSTQVR